MTDTTPDMIIIGGGAAAVAAAWPLVEAGKRVLMLAPQPAGQTDIRDTLPYARRRREDADQWREFLGEDFGGIGRGAAETPKMKVPGLRFVQKGFLDHTRMSHSDITPTGSLTAGGLTQMWGAGAFCYLDEDLQGFPIRYADLKPSYKRLSERIGISGTLDDEMAPILGEDVTLQPPIPLHPGFGDILNRYHDRKRTDESFTLGRTRNAVLTQDREGRLGCNLSNLCLWGCPRQSIWSAAHDLDRLKTFDNFTLDDSAYVERIEKLDTSGNAPLYRLHIENVRDGASGERPIRQIDAPQLMLAAGTLGSTRLAMGLMGRIDQPQPLATHPAFAMAGLNWRRVGQRATENGFALGHMAYRIQLSADDSQAAFGVVFPSEGLMMSDLAANMPLSMRGAIGLTRTLAPALIVMNGYVCGEHGHANMTLKADGSVHLDGGRRESFDRVFKAVTKKLKREMGKLGVLPLPGGTRVAELGSDGHFAAGLAMTDTADPDRLTTTPDGELRGAPGVYCVDGAALSRLSPKHPTFTLMANADRISSRLCENWRL